MFEGSTFRDLADDDDHSRLPHEYTVDAFTHSFIQNLEEPELQDAIILRETDFFYTPRNTDIEKIKKKDGRPRDIYGKPKGDLDFAIIYLDDERIEHYEIKKSEPSQEVEERNRSESSVNQRVKEQKESVVDAFESSKNGEKIDWDQVRAEIEDDQKEHRKDESSGAEGIEEQKDNVVETVHLMNNIRDTDWIYIRDEIFADEEQPDIDDHPPEYTGDYAHSDEAYQKAVNSEAFQALNEFFFKGELFENDYIHQKQA